jgi:uncharacterized protein
MNLNPHHVFSHDRGVCLIITEEMEAVDISEDTASLIETVKKNSAPEIPLKVLDQLRDLKLIEWQLPVEETEAKEPVTIMKIALFVSQDCNFNCVYCYGAEEEGSVGGTYGSRGKMTAATAAKAVDWLMVQSKDDEKVGIVFFGGEPFMNYPVMKQVVEYANARAKEYNKTVDYSVTTNGSLLNDEKIAFLKDNKIYPTVSMDGNREIQDKQRPLPNGKGTYDLTAPKVRKLLKAIPTTSCRGTIFDDRDTGDAEKGLRDLGFATTYLTVASPSLFDNKPDQKPTKKRFDNSCKKARREFDQIRMVLKDRDSETLRSLQETGTWAKKIIRFTQEFRNHEKRYFPCGAGRHYVGVSSSGDVYPCHRLVGGKDQKLGSIFGKKLDREVFHKTAMGVQDKNNCAKCYAKYVCAGGCHHDNLGATGHVHGPDNEMCDLTRYVVGLAAVLCSQLTDEDKAFLIGEKIIIPKACPIDIF